MTIVSVIFSSKKVEFQLKATHKVSNVKCQNKKNKNVKKNWKTICVRKQQHASSQMSNKMFCPKIKNKIHDTQNKKATHNFSNVKTKLVQQKNFM